VYRDQTNFIVGQEASETREELRRFLLSDELRWGRRKIGRKFHQRIFCQHLQQISGQCLRSRR